MSRVNYGIYSQNGYMKVNFFLIFFAILFLCNSKSHSGWVEEVNFRSLSTTAQDIRYLQEQLQKLLQPLKYELQIETIDISNFIFGVIPSGAPVVIINKSESIRLVTFEVLDKNIQKKYKGYIYLLSTKDLTIDLNKTEQFYKSTDVNKSFKLSLIQKPSKNYYSLDIAPQSLHLTEKK